MGFQRTIGAMILGLFVRQRIVGLLSTPNQKDLTELAELMTAGKVTPLVNSTHALKDAARVIEAVGAGHGAGTQVITI
jgi:D-arabinose 1-dehydrogenase-like Zn-dependent alcohol dehydrogenase